MRGFLIALTMAWLVVCAPAFADEVTPSDEVVTGVIIRAEASTQSARLGLMRPGETLTIDGEAPGWWRVRLDGGRTGYVSKRWTLRLEEEAPDPSGPSTLVETARGAMFAHFVYVGQGGGAILEFPCGVAVIDSGGQYRGQHDGGLQFIDYLDTFFEARPHLNDTINVVFTTHPHADHVRGLASLLDDEGAPRYTIDNVVDNGQNNDDSAPRQKAFRDAVRAHDGRYQRITVTAAIRGDGVSNDIIDPINCGARGDPEISVLWGGWSASTVRSLGGLGRDHDNPNQRSLVIRVEYGGTSMLFTGDLERQGIEDLLAVHRADLSAFNVDIYVVGHHGSPNATTTALLAAMTPEIAVISAGRPADRGPSTGWDHGHPRDALLNLLQDDQNGVSSERDPLNVRVFAAEETEPVNFTVTGGIYSTSWEGDLVLRVDQNGGYAFVDPDE